MLDFFKKKKYVWYACYGSNLSSERFSYYIKGGQLPNNGKEYEGCRDQSDWIESSMKFFDGEIYFGNKSKTWFGGGVMFYDPSAEGQVFMRLYKITREQMEDVQKQEGLSPNWYGNLVDLGKADDGYQIYTITSENRRPVNPPHDAYYDLIRKALAEENGMGYEWTDEYMKKALGGDFDEKGSNTEKAECSK